MTSDTRLVRLAGLLYLLFLPTTGPAYWSGRLLLEDAPAALLTNLEAGRTAFELMIVLGLIGFVDYLVAAVVLYRVLAPFGKTAAGSMLTFVGASVPLSLAALSTRLDVLTLLDSSAALGGDLLQSDIVLMLHSAHNLMSMSTVFWGLWLVPLGWLLWRSGFVPRLVAALLILGSVYYVAAFIGTVMDPGFENSMLGRVLGFASLLPGTLAELATALWLLIGGGRRARRRPAAGS